MFHLTHQQSKQIREALKKELSNLAYPGKIRWITETCIEFPVLHVISDNIRWQCQYDLDKNKLIVIKEFV